jgi:hypothetical protein
MEDPAVADIEDILPTQTWNPRGVQKLNRYWEYENGIEAL